MSGIRVFPRPMKMPNFLRYPRLNAEDGLFDVGELSVADAASLWDEWKQEWLGHVGPRATSTVTADTEAK